MVAYSLKAPAQNCVTETEVIRIKLILNKKEFIGVESFLIYLSSKSEEKNKKFKNVFDYL